jgi:ATP-dependent DNA helicase RecG
VVIPAAFTLAQALSTLHFPERPEQVTTARERLALEELLCLIDHSTALQQTWKARTGSSHVIPIDNALLRRSMTQLPFQLTTDQSRAIDTITQNMTSGTTMNRLLVGDVGSGKTVVAFAVAAQVLAAGKHAFLIAPTQVLAEQHAQNYRRHITLLP